MATVYRVHCNGKSYWWPSKEIAEAAARIAIARGLEITVPVEKFIITLTKYHYIEVVSVVTKEGLLNTHEPCDGTQSGT